jgi:hypothetical protein
VGLVIIVWPGYWVARHRRIERAIACFESVPSQKGVGELTELLNKQAATNEQGRRILTLLLRPKVTTRQTYPVREPIRVSVESMYHVGFQGRLVFEQSVWSEQEQLVDSRKRRISAVTDTPETFVVHASPEEPGTYHANIRYECTVAYQRDPQLFLNHLPHQIRPSVRHRIYSCRFDVPVEVRVVERQAVERLELLMSPLLNEKMAAAITCRSSDQSPHLTRSGRQVQVTILEIACKNLPLAVAFEPQLRLSDGRVLPLGETHYARRIRVRTGSSHSFPVNPSDFGIEDPGEHTATLILMPDPNHAYEDSAIKAIWNGTLEFPISFTVSPEPDTMP